MNQRYKNYNEVLVREGCVAWCQDFNGEEVSNMTPEQQTDVIHKLVEYIPADYASEFVNWFAKTFVDMYGEYTSDDKPCEECGDYVEEWRLKLPLTTSF